MVYGYQGGRATEPAIFISGTYASAAALARRRNDGNAARPEMHDGRGVAAPAAAIRSEAKGAPPQAAVSSSSLNSSSLVTVLSVTLIRPSSTSTTFSSNTGACSEASAFGSRR